MTESKRHKHSFKRRLPVIRCECGYEILFLPDLKAMSQAIDKHVLEHKKNGAIEVEAIRIENALISKVLNSAAESKT